jgi:hypothetical protein
MRRKMMKALSLALGAMVSSSAHAQGVDDIACEYGVEPPPDFYDPEPVPLYGIEEPTYLARTIIVTGRVVLEGTVEPIEGIQLTLGEQTALTGPDGRFGFSTTAPDPNATWDLLAEDIDGDDHGGKHKPAKLTVVIQDGALSPLIGEEGLLVQMKPK